MPDISSKKDIEFFVDQFYSRVRTDEIIGPIFLKKIEDKNWPKHLTRMSGFWNTVLFGVPDYRGNPFSHHTSLGIHKIHFDRWILIFTKTLEETYEGPKADEVLERAGKMRLMFESKLEYLKSNPNIKPII